MEARISTEVVKYTFTDPELLDLSRRQARKFEEKRLAEERKKQFTDQVKAEITALEAEISGITSRVQSGYEMRDVKVLTLRYRPTRDEKLKVRLDSGIVFARARLTGEERQLELREDAKPSHIASIATEEGPFVVVEVFAAEAKALADAGVEVREIASAEEAPVQ